MNTTHNTCRKCGGTPVEGAPYCPTCEVVVINNNLRRMMRRTAHAFTEAERQRVMKQLAANRLTGADLLNKLTN